ncbi:glycoside hydrolase family 26 protein [Actinacidiphila sp. bgisy145]|uniref:glycoside hydrolase family 26 protein n=1 Tax=Actinacidiphila sp. bgisy145 TaxID=3413792 RepID=UPI003EC0C5A0
MAERHHWWARGSVALATAAVLLSGATATGLGDDSAGRLLGRPAYGTPVAGPLPSQTAPRSGPSAGTPTTAPSAAPSPAAPANGGLPAMGAFTDSGAKGVQSLAGLQTWLGGTQVNVGHTYLPGDDWDSIEGGGDLLQPWADWTRAQPGRLFVLNVPMQADNEGHVPDAQVRDLIEQGASGAFDAHFTTLARRLVRLGVPDTVLVLGWEMNGTTYTHRCGPDPEGWKAYWNHVVTAMRAVPGQHFRFDFAPNRGQDAIGWTTCYPGDSTVDIIGMDSYDQPSGETFQQQVTEPYGLQAQVDFAAAHKKAISYPEWGLFRNGDDPDYMSLMLTWIITHHPLYQTITDYCPHGVWQCAQNPASSKVYRALLYDRKTVSAAPASPAPTPSPGTSPTSAPAESCVPMPLSEVLKQSYASGQVCVRLEQRPKPSATAAMPSPGPTSAL